MPKSVYTLRTSECSGNPLLDEFDRCLRDDLTRILNIDMNDDQWLQASLPVRNVELGISNSTKLAPSAFFGIRCFQALSPGCNSSTTPPSLRRFITNRSGNLCHQLRYPLQHYKNVQTAWDRPIGFKIQAAILGRAYDVNDKARLLAAAFPHSGDWLHSPIISYIGLRLDEEMIRVSIGLKLRVKTCDLTTEDNMIFLSQKHSKATKTFTDQRQFTEQSYEHRRHQTRTQLDSYVTTVNDQTARP